MAQSVRLDASSAPNLYQVAPLVGRLPLCEERAIIELKACRLLSDVDVDRSSRECGGDCQRELPDEHLPPLIFAASLPPVGPKIVSWLKDVLLSGLAVCSCSGAKMRANRTEYLFSVNIHTPADDERRIR